MHYIFHRKAALRGLLLFLLAGVAGFVGTGDRAEAATITRYQVLVRPARDAAGKSVLVTRSFERDGVPCLLVVDPVTLESTVRRAAAVTVAKSAGLDPLAGSSIGNALERETAAPYRLQNHGATHGRDGAAGVFLTVDLCPSKRPFEYELFQAAAALKQGGAVPVAVMTSGVWLEHHPQELAWLKDEVRAGRLAITWVNHSYHHPYEPKVPLQRNFLLTPGTNFDAEVLDVERLLLENGVVPSVFFRFPGLVSDEATVKRLRELALIPVGSDAWLAKGERPRQGSIILVHGNGNEHKGVQLALPLLRSGALKLLPLASAFAP